MFILNSQVPSSIKIGTKTILCASQIFFLIRILSMSSLRAQETVGVVKLQRYHFRTHNEYPSHDVRLER